MQKCKNLTPNTDITNDSLCNSCTSARRKFNNNKINCGTETVTNTETNSVTINNEEENGEVAEAEAKATKNSAKSNSSNNGIVRSNSKSNYVDTKILNAWTKTEMKR